MNQSVLMYADINKSAEVYYVSYCSAEYHIGLKVLHRHYVVTKHGRGQTVTNVTSGLVLPVNSYTFGADGKMVK